MLRWVPSGHRKRWSALPLRLGAQMTPLGLETSGHPIPDGCLDDKGVLAGAGGGIVEGLALRDLPGGIRQIGRLIHDADRIAGPHPVGGGATGVGRFHHGGATRGDDQVHRFHQGLGELDGGLGDVLHEVLGRPDLAQAGPHIPTGQRGGAFRRRVRGEDDGVPPLQDRQAVTAERRGGIGDRRERSDDAHRLGEFQQPAGAVLLDAAHGLHALEVPEGPERLLLVFEQLVLKDTHAGLLTRQAGAGLGVLAPVGGPAHCRDHLVDLLLGPMLDGGLGDSSLFDHFLHRIRHDHPHLS